MKDFFNLFLKFLEEEEKMFKYYENYVNKLDTSKIDNSSLLMIQSLNNSFLDKLIRFEANSLFMSFTDELDFNNFFNEVLDINNDLAFLLNFTWNSTKETLESENFRRRIDNYLLIEKELLLEYPFIKDKYLFKSNGQDLSMDNLRNVVTYLNLLKINGVGKTMMDIYGSSRMWIDTKNVVIKYLKDYSDEKEKIEMFENNFKSMALKLKKNVK